MKKSKRIKSLVAVMLAVFMLLLTACGNDSSSGSNSSDAAEAENNKIVEYLDKGNYDDAAAEYNIAKAPGSSITDKFIEKIKETYTEFKNNEIEYVTATARLESLGKADSDKVKSAKNETLQKVNDLNDSRTAFKTAEAFEKEKNYGKAIENYAKVIEEDENYSVAQQKLTTCSESARTEALDSAKQSADGGDYETALKTLNDALEVLPNDSELTRQSEVYKEAYVKAVLDKADALVKEKKFDEAKELINKAQELVPDDESLTQKLDDINNSYPVNLSEIHIIESNNYEHSESGVTDAFDNNYSDAYWFNGNDAYSIFYLEKKYSSFSGTIVIPTGNETDSEVGISIYADKKLIYSKTKLPRITKPFDFDVNVKDCDQLEIKSSSSNGWGSKKITIVNAILTK